MPSFSQLAHTTAAYQRLLFFPEAKLAVKYRGAIHRAPIAADENIVGLCTQVKHVEGKNTQLPTITFIVKKKKSISRLNQSQQSIIPSELPAYDATKRKFIRDKRFKTDVEECQNIVLAGGTLGFNGAYIQRIRPIPGGHSVGNVGRKNAGTLGFWVELVNKGLVGISNYHVLRSSPHGQSDKIVQPGRLDKEKFGRNIIGSQVDYFEYSDSDNFVDLAYFAPDNVELVKDEIEFIGKYNGFVTPARGMKVAKVGRTTGYTEGTIQAVDATIKIPVGKKSVLFVQQVKTDCKLKEGDSGSALVELSSKAICGLCFASYVNGTSSFANNIRQIIGKSSKSGWRVK